MMIILLLVNLSLLVLAVIVLLGKGDSLIAGYNTSGEREKRQVDIRRLRRVVAGMLLLSAASLSAPWLCGVEDRIMPHIASAFAIMVVAVLGLIIANTWCMKK